MEVVGLPLGFILLEHLPLRVVSNGERVDKPGDIESLCPKL